tara:strand:- start:1557 stop:1766 length:210 start_codon:yes stop_codon:yes gene_type:complete
MSDSEPNSVQMRTGKLALALLTLSGVLAALRWLDYLDAPLWAILAPIWAPFGVAMILAAIFGLIVKFRK